MKKIIDFRFYARLCSVVALSSFGIFILFGLPIHISDKIHISAKIILGITSTVFSLILLIDVLLIYQIPVKIATAIHYGKVINYNENSVTLAFDQYTMEDGPLQKKFNRNDFYKVPKIGEVIKVKMILRNIGKI